MKKKTLTLIRYFNKAIHAIWQYARYVAFMRKHNRTTIRAKEVIYDALTNASITIAFPQCDVHLIREE